VLPDSFAPTHGWVTSWVLPFVAIAAVAAYVAIDRRSRRGLLGGSALARARGTITGVLAVAALLSAVSYVDFGRFRYGTYLNEWDFYHYYVGTKYAREIGYMDLYAATLVADEAGGLRYDNPEHRLRDLRTSEFIDVSEVLAERDAIKARLSPERFRELVGDISWFKSQLPRDRWSLLLMDKGYNGTPAWSFVVGGLFTTHLSVESPPSRWSMLLLDPLLILATLLCVAWAFDVRAALLMMVFIGTHYLMSWGHMKGALLRTDFALCTVLAACSMKKGHYRVSGALLGWAVLSRVFPVVFLLGPLARFASIGLSERRIDRPLLGFFIACGATIAFFVLGSILYFGGVQPWAEWAEKILQHYSDFSHWQIGYQTLMEVDIVDGVPIPMHPAVHLAEEPGVRLRQQVVIWAVRACVLVPAFVFAKSLEDWEALVFGFVFVFFGVSAVYYYYFILAAPLLFFAAKLERPARAFGLSFMFLTGAAGYLFFSGWAPLSDVLPFFHGWHQEFPTYYFMSWLIAFTALMMVGIAAAEAQRRAKAGAGAQRPRSSSASASRSLAE
jgi:hypothetical protein